ncbi:MAG TPA: radical SAM protein [Kiritimatiellae bacterium]|nr:radical SAM protein [Kiritimatiellia bacterium]
MGVCSICGHSDPLISRELGICLECIRRKPAEARRRALHVHRRTRKYFGLEPSPPRADSGIPCHLCANLCRIPEDRPGYCGARRNEHGKLVGATESLANVSWYHDPLPTNCVADWVCPGGSGAGYPRFAHSPGPERGYDNLAVFFHACTFNCLFCQNWHFRYDTLHPRIRRAEELADAVGKRTACICFFGGDPAAQFPFALEAARIARQRAQGRILRICWETNGSLSPSCLERMLDISQESGGCLKFDLKAFDETLHLALTGVPNRRTLANFRRAARRAKERPDPPLLIASTLLVPGCVDAREVQAIASFIAELDPNIPYNLLAFHPDFLMQDLPVTGREHAFRCREAARSAGLLRVVLGNAHLLGAGS